MFDDLFKGELGKVLDQALEGLDELTKTSFGPGAASAANVRWQGQEKCSFDDFKVALQQSAAAGQSVINKTPQEIDLRPIWPIVERLQARGAAGIEHGRIGFVHLPTGKLVFGKTHGGGAGSVLITDESPPGWKRWEMRPSIMMHTHPSGIVGSTRGSEHFSPQDFHSFLSLRPLIASIVVTEGTTLLALKTTSTVNHHSLERLQELYHEMDSPLSLTANSTRRFTKLACLELGISLYTAPKDRPGVFRRVELK